jgi:hypothetical protein
MAIGLLGAGSGGAASYTLVYTVPAGISHAVVHITLCNGSFTSNTEGRVSVQESTSSSYIDVLVVAAVPPSAQVSAYGTISDSVSMMLSPGCKIYVTGQNASCTVSGYEVA